VLEVEGLSAGYGKIQILHDVSFGVTRGQVVSLVGANGAGKTTLVNTIVGLITPRSGQIRLAGSDTTHMEPWQRASRGMVLVPQGRGLFPRMTILENLLAASVHSRARGKRQDNLHLVMQLFPRLEERKRQLAQTMSGGEQQMLAIARALMCVPDILLLDEPSQGLAPVVVKEVFRTIVELNRRGLTVLLIEQNVVDSLRICHHAHVLEHGKVVLSGTGEELLSSPSMKDAYLGI